MFGPEYPAIERCIPNDHSRRSAAEDMLAATCRDLGNDRPSVLDFGCGTGDGADIIRKHLPGARYVGVDIETSPEVDSRTRRDVEFHSYDGETLPFDDASMDIVYTRQVFEHVRHPDRAMQEIARVLRPGGVLVGSLSNLEPYHSFSIFNYTPYGLYRVIEDNGLTLQAMRPGPEGTSLAVRQLTMRRIGRFQLVYPMVELFGRLRKWSARKRNYIKLRFSGHICFAAVKPRA